MIQSILIQSKPNRILSSVTLLNYKNTNRRWKTPVAAERTVSKQRNLN